jgi:hypothetical protein
VINFFWLTITFKVHTVGFYFYGQNALLCVFFFIDDDAFCRVLFYQWLEEDSLKSGEKLTEDLYVLKLDPQGEGINEPDKSLDPNY